jgi:ribonuclease J
MENKFFSILPLGGVQEIGSNMTLIRTANEDIVIDCGMLFPYEDCFNIKYLIPDFSNIEATRFKSVIITHGHEDHIGGLAHLLKSFPDITVYATKFTLNLIQKKMEEFKIKFEYTIYHENSELHFQDIDIYPVHVNHSIPETCGLMILTKKREWGSLYISDFKIDLNSLHEKPFDLPRIKEFLSKCNKTIYFLDSTNILSDEKTTTESELHKDLKKLVERSENRIFITLFASNVHRIDTIARLAINSGRKIVIMGRSLKTYIQTAIDSNLIDLKIEDIFEPEQVKGESGKMLIFLSGCQGDFLSALRRFSYGEDSIFKPHTQDVVVFSSKVIPGNEKKIYRIYNKLTEFGATVITANDLLIHASGHPGKKDLEILINNFKPNFYVPIHGETYLLNKHFEFIVNKFPEISSHQILNYHEVILSDETIKIQIHDAKEPKIIHGKSIEIEKSQISQRRKLANQGAVFISYHKKLEQMEITALGLPNCSEKTILDLKKILIEQIRTNLSGREDEFFKNQLKIFSRQFYNNILGYKPVTEVHLF